MANFEDLIDFDEYKDQDKPAIDSGDDIFKNDDDLHGNQNDDSHLKNDDDIFKNQDDDLITELLKSKGIEDSSKIQIIDEDGSESEISFSDLSKEEQLAILNDSDSPEMSDYEVEVINYLRENNASLDDLIEYGRQLGLKEASENQDNVRYSVEDLSDDQIYLLDLSNRYPNFTDDDLSAELDKEKNNPDLFTKKIQALRESYTELEKQQLTQEQEQQNQQLAQEQQEFLNTMNDIANKVESLYGLELEDSDKEDVLSFMFDQDINGVAEFTKMFNDPESLFKLAWFAKKGEEAFDAVHDYYKKEIDSLQKQIKSNSGTQPRKNTVVVKPTTEESDPYGLKTYFKPNK